VSITSFHNDEFILLSGAGGQGTGGSVGGASGLLEKVSLRAASSDGFQIGSGDSGTGSTRGASGSVFSVTAQLGTVRGNGDAIISTGDGGVIGSLFGINVSISSGQVDDLLIVAGAGTVEGGNVTNVRVDLGRELRVDNFRIMGGDGFDSAEFGGDGGGVNRVTVNATGQIRVGSISGGNEGDSGAAFTGGTAGWVTDVKFTNNGSITGFLAIEGGAGGESEAGGGHGGGVDRLSIGKNGFGKFRVAGGHASSGATLADLTAASGGSVTNVNFKDRVGGTLVVLAGNGGDGEIGGAAGEIRGIKLTAPLADVFIGSETTGQGGESLAGTGGAGANISGVTGKVGFLAAIAGDGGDGLSGGAGGSVQGFKLTASIAVQQIRAGSGGTAEVGGVAGVGGSIADINVRGDIGNFEQPFGIDLDEMGGLIAGMGGGGGAANGSVTNVQATRIAAIFAANSQTTASNLTLQNAVTSIVNV
jgi:hypothetical protein